MKNLFSKIASKLTKSKPTYVNREFQTNNLKQHGHPEIVIHISDNAILDIDVKTILDGFENEVSRGVEYQDGESLQLGWMLNEFQTLDDGRLILAEPDMTSFPINFIPTMNATFKYLRQHKDVVESVNTEMMFPGITEALSVHKDYINSDALTLERHEPEGSLSGWKVSVEDDFDESKHSLVSLYQMALDRPDLIKYLALPNGVKVQDFKGKGIDIYIDDVKVDYCEDSYLAILTK